MSTPSQSLPPRASKAVKVSKRKKKRPILRAFLTICLTILIAAICYGVFIFNQAGKMIKEISAGTSEVVAETEKADVKAQTILVLGLDARNGIGTMNTDVIMVVSLNPDDKAATIVSIPRDTYIKPSNYRNGFKANAFYAIEHNDDEEAALDNVKQVFSEFLDIHIDYVSIVNFSTFEDIIDELGGIWVDVDMDMRWVDNADGTDINLTAGYQKMNGKDALDFVRYRQSNRGTAPSSDFERNQRQQQVIKAMVDQLKSFDVVFKVTGIFNAVGKNIETDIPAEQIVNFIKTYASIRSDSIEYIPIEGTWESPYIYLNEEQFNSAKLKLKQRLDPSLADAASHQSDEADTDF